MDASVTRKPTILLASLKIQFKNSTDFQENLISKV